MESLDPDHRTYLDELCRMVDSDAAAQVSMYDVGTEIGLDRSRSGEIAEELMVEGLIELKTLSGGICITSEGLQRLDRKQSKPGITVHRLGEAQYLDEQAVAAVVRVLEDSKKELSNSTMTYDQMDEIVIDLKTLEVQLLSGTPKTAVARAVLHGLVPLFSTIGLETMAQQIELMVSSKQDKSQRSG